MSVNGPSDGLCCGAYEGRSFRDPCDDESAVYAGGQKLVPIEYDDLPDVLCPQSYHSELRNG
jgi:hypothetical protein